MPHRAIVYLGANPEEGRERLSHASAGILADYGPSMLVEAEEPELEALRQSGLRVRVREKPDTLRVEGFELAASGPALALAAGTPETGRRAYVLDLAGPLHPDWQARIEAEGGELIEQLDEDHHLVRIDAVRADSLAQESFVDNLLPYFPALKVHPDLLTVETQAILAEPEGLSAVALPELAAPAEIPDFEKLTQRPEPASDNANANVLLFDDVDAAAVAEEVGALGAQIFEIQPGCLQVEATPEQVAAIAELSEVRRIDPYAPFKLANNVAANLVRADVAQNHLGLDGSGQIVAVADSGLDTGVNNASLMADFRGRVVSILPLGRPNDASDPDGHGTHVAGSVLGDGSLSNGTVRGMAPGARLVFQSVLDASGGLGGLSVGLASLFGQARALGARIHTNSWGARTKGAYTATSKAADSFAFENRDFLIVFAAGNEAPERVSSPGSAKNVLTVGASESLRALPATVRMPPSPIFPDGPVFPGFDREADNADEIARFSCRGPADAGRRKPDVVAPGTWILSTRSSVAVADNGPDGIGRSPSLPNGTLDEDGIPTHDEAVGLGLPGRPILGAGNSNTPPLPPGAPSGAEERYMYQNGTSMATPLTAGACALIRQHLVQEFGHQPSAALLKAFVVNGARDLGAGVPTMAQGWGRLDLGNTLQPPAGFFFDDSLANSLATGGVFTQEVEVEAGSEPISVTLVWRDFPGPALQNRLLLRLVKVATGEATEAEPIQQIRNNVQRISVEQPQPGTYRIEVEAIGISRGIPELAPALRQDFALVVAGAKEA